MFYHIIPVSVGKVCTAGEWDEFGDVGTSAWRKTKVRTKSLTIRYTTVNGFHGVH